MKKAFVILIVMVALAGCAQETQTKTREIKPSLDVVTIADGGFSYGLHRIIDHDAGIACWVARGFEAIGVTCLPLSATTLGGGH